MRPLRNSAGVELAPALLRQSHQRVARVSVLDDLFNPLPGLVFTGELGHTLDGQVSQDVGKLVRRSLSLTLANPGGVWTPDGPGDPFWWDKLISVERGVRAGGLDYLAPMGVFLIDTPAVSGNVLAISGADRLDRALRSKFTEPESITAGTRVGVAIRGILEDAGVGTTQWTVDDGGATLGATRYYEPDEERMSAAKTLATDFSLEVYADATGYIVIRPKVDPATLAASWLFSAGADSTTLEVSKQWSRDRFYNRVVAIGESAEGVPVRGNAAITDLASPLRVGGTMGDRLYTHKSAMITTVSQANAVAASLLWEHALIEEELEVQHVPHPGLEAGDGVRIVDVPSHTDDVYMVDSITIPLGDGASSLGVHKARLIG
jgi:hypothetical protein